MAGLNSQFKKNPVVFVQTHDIIVNPQTQLGANAIPAGLTDVDLTMADATLNPQVARLEHCAPRAGGFFTEASLSAYFLPAINDNTSTIAIANAADYMFTSDLSGCLFAAYGPDSTALTVEHVNVRTAAAAVPIAPRAAAIIAAAHPFLFMITPVPVLGAGVVNYTTGGVVVGRRNIGGGWNFVYRVDGNPVGVA